LAIIRCSPSDRLRSSGLTQTRKGLVIFRRYFARPDSSVFSIRTVAAGYIIRIVHFARCASASLQIAPRWCQRWARWGQIIGNNLLDCEP
jgi:hypothetical protein